MDKNCRKKKRSTWFQNNAVPTSAHMRLLWPLLPRTTYHFPAHCDSVTTYCWVDWGRPTWSSRELGSNRGPLDQGESDCLVCLVTLVQNLLRNAVFHEILMLRKITFLFAFLTEQFYNIWLFWVAFRVRKGFTEEKIAIKAAITYHHQLQGHMLARVSVSLEGDGGVKMPIIPHFLRHILSGKEILFPDIRTLFLFPWIPLVLSKEL